MPAPSRGVPPPAKKAWRKKEAAASSSSSSTSRRLRLLKPILGALVAIVALLQVYTGDCFGRTLPNSGRRVIVINLPEQQQERSTDNNRSTTITIGPWTFHAHASSIFKPANASQSWQPENFYEGLPVSDYRPSGQFYVRPQGPSSTLPPVITIVTATRNPREIFFTRTVRFVLQQSLQAFRWVVVNDGSDDAVAVLRLKEFKQWAATHEPDRILVVDRETTSSSQRQRGNGPAAMNYGLRLVDNTTEFVAILDDDDLWELTTLEKAVLVMSWVPQAYAVSFDVVNHGFHRFMWKRGFYNGDESFFTENNLMQGSPFRASVLQQCRFGEEDMADGGADWDFWMCMASHGMWGMHVPESGNWYQWNPPDFRKRRWKAVTTHKGLEDLRQRIQKRYANLLDEDAWPAMVLPPSVSLSLKRREEEEADHPPPYKPPFVNRVAVGKDGRKRGQKRSVFLVLRDLASGGTVVEHASAFAQAGWRVTVLMTHYHDDDANDDASQSRQQRLTLMQYTHDVFTGANVAPLLKLADLVAYLVESRGVEAVVVLPDPSPLQISRRLVDAGVALLRPAVLAVVDFNESPIKDASTLDVVEATERAINLARERGDKRRNHQPSPPAWPAFVQQLAFSTDPVLNDRGMDMRRIQLALQYRKKRTGFGRELQIACPERVYGNTQWIDALERPEACADDSTSTIALEVASLQRSAMKQCGAWCLVNLVDDGGGEGGSGAQGSLIIGWEFSGSCFRQLTSPSDSPKCQSLSVILLTQDRMHNNNNKI